MPGLFGGSGPGQNAQEKALTTAETGLVGTQTQAANFGLSTAEKYLPTAFSTLTGPGGPLQYYQTLASGNPSAISQLIAPDVANISSQYTQAQKATDEFGARGGGATAANAEAQYGEAGAIASLFTGARQTGETGLSTIAQLLGSMSLGSFSAGAGSAAGAASTAGSTVGQLQTQQQMQQQAQAALGGGLGSIIALLVGAA